MKDLFIDIQAKIGVMYISDLPYYKEAVWNELMMISLDEYDIKQLEDFSRYVFNTEWTAIKEKKKDCQKH